MRWGVMEIQKVLLDPEGKTGEHENRYLIYRMLQAMYQRQTAAEQMSGSTYHRNGVGFNGIDATLLSDVAQRSTAYQNLTPKQAAMVGRRLRKYVKQLVEIAEENERAKVAA